MSKYRILKKCNVFSYSPDSTYKFCIEKKSLFGWKQIDYYYSEEQAIKVLDNYIKHGTTYEVIKEI